MAAVCNKMLLFCAIACWRGGPVSAGRDLSNLNRLVRRSAAAGSVVGATLDTVGEMEKSNLTCFSTTDPQSVKVNHIFVSGEDAGYLWRGQPADMSPCYNTSTPAPSRCVPCRPDRNQTVLVHIVCKDIPETTRLEMEADGEGLDINITAVDCPSFAKPAEPDAALKVHLKEPERSTDGRFPWWVWLCVTLGVIIAVAVPLSVLGYWKRKSIQTKYLFVRSKFITPKPPAGDEDRHTNGHALSEVRPMMNGVKPDGT